MHNGEDDYYEDKPGNIPAQPHTFTVFWFSDFSLFGCNQ
jgi:hypothetical protein